MDETDHTACIITAEEWDAVILCRRQDDMCEDGGRRKNGMAYRLERDESVPQALRRIAREQLASAADELGKRGSKRAEGIHEARKSIKKVRAVLRLVRQELGNTYRKEN